MSIYIVSVSVFAVISSAIVLFIGKKFYKLFELKYINILLSLLVSLVGCGLIFYFTYFLSAMGSWGILGVFIVPAIVFLGLFHLCLKKSVPTLDLSKSFVFLIIPLILSTILFLVVIVPMINSQF